MDPDELDPNHPVELICLSHKSKTDKKKVDRVLIINENTGIAKKEKLYCYRVKEEKEGKGPITFKTVE